MSADTTTAGPAAGQASFAFPRHEQTFPTLTSHEIERMRRFGELRSYKHGETLFETGKPGPGMFVVLSGHVAITLRDGLGHITPVIDQCVGQFVAEIGQLSGRVALVDGHGPLAEFFDAQRPAASSARPRDRQGRRRSRRALFGRAQRPAAGGLS
jgi:thioredoxin reductase (NADPH)